ncbi:DUF5680 domain-containing protein [Rhizobium sp. PAMB 3182]
MLEEFIVEAKAAAYVGGGKPGASSRAASHDIGYRRGHWSYLDSYFGGTDFLGQETVWTDGVPVWAMNYYGRISDDDAINAEKAGSIVKQARAALYNEGRFLGEFKSEYLGYRYEHGSAGTPRSFQGVERIYRADREVYRLDFHGGLIRP